MRKEDVLKRIAKKAKADAKKRKDPRFLAVMGFLVAKGFLRTNYPMVPLPNKKLLLTDAIWAGKNVEPRILEVLPAAVFRLRAHFHFDPAKHRDLIKVLEALKGGQLQGPEFNGIPFEKLQAWINLPLKDRRIKSVGTKKIPRTFRLSPAAISKLKEMASKMGYSETEYLEKKLLEN